MNPCPFAKAALSAFFAVAQLPLVPDDCIKMNRLWNTSYTSK